jgi:hypothetical protein
MGKHYSVSQTGLREPRGFRECVSGVPRNDLSHLENKCHMFTYFNFVKYQFKAVLEVQAEAYYRERYVDMKPK